MCCCSRLSAQWQRERSLKKELQEGLWVEAFCSEGNRYFRGRGLHLTFQICQIVFFLAILAWSIYQEIEDGCGTKYLAFGTYQTLIAQVAYTWFWAAATTHADTLKHSTDRKAVPMPWYATAAWVSRDLAVSMLFFVVLTYWGLFVPARSEPPNTVSYFTHGVNFVVFVVGMFASRLPYTLWHGIGIFVTVAWYISFTVVYHLLDGTDCSGDPYIYPNLNYNEPVSSGALFTVLLFFLFGALNLFFWYGISQCFPYRVAWDEVQPKQEFQEA